MNSAPPIRRVTSNSVLLVASLIALAFATACGPSTTETPDYVVKKTQASPQRFELRQYEPELVAETTVVASNFRSATRQGFRLLADYIFGNNTAVAGGSQKVAMTSPVEARPAVGQKLAMTSPVEARPTGEDTAERWTVTFILPSKLTLETAPRPNNTAVKVRQREGQLMAVRAFSGWMTPAMHDEEKSKLLSDVKAAGWNTAGPVTAAQYDAPSVPAERRRNEVMVPVSR